MLSNCTALLCELHSTPTTEEPRLSDWTDDRLLHRRVAGRGPVPVLRRAPRRSARCCRSPTSASWRSPATTRRARSTATPTPSRRATRWSGPSPRSRCRSRATTCSDIVAEHRDQLPMHEHMVTMDPPDHTRERALLMRLLTPEAPQGQRGVHVAPRRPAARRVRRRRPLRVHQRLRPALRHARRRRRARRARGGPPAVPRGLRPDRHRRRGRRRRGGQPGREPAGLARRVFAAYIEDRRREPRKDVLTDLALATYPDGIDARRHLGRAHRDVPVRRRPGDHRPPARRRAEAPGRAPRAPGRSCGPTTTGSPTSSRRCCGSRAR